jgi:hypothetical protein
MATVDEVVLRELLFHTCRLPQIRTRHGEFETAPPAVARKGEKLTREEGYCLEAAAGDTSRSWRHNRGMNNLAGHVRKIWTRFF